MSAREARHGNVPRHLCPLRPEDNFGRGLLLDGVSMPDYRPDPVGVHGPARPIGKKIITKKQDHILFDYQTRTPSDRIRHARSVSIGREQNINERSEEVAAALR